MTPRDAAHIARLDLAPEPGALRAARRAVSEAVQGLRSLERADLMLLVSEAVSVVTGGAPVAVTIDVTHSDSGVRVDARSGAGSVLPDDLATALFDDLAVDWHVEPGHVWFELASSGRFDAFDEDRDLFLRNAAGDIAARDELADRYRGYARAFARRFVKAGVRRDDLDQVASVGLVQALERFDPNRGVKFTTFAGRTIEGELKRHLRDAGWSVRVPRGLQELGLEAARTASDLSQQDGRPPTLADLADAMDADQADVGEALLARRSFDSASLDAPIGGESSLRLIDAIPAHDERLVAAPEWSDLSQVMDRLPERQQRILFLRFFEDLSQAEIGERVGVSQMHVSRLLAKSIARLRELIDPDDFRDP
jgi:RNA polymerase sigma-B factor